MTSLVITGAVVDGERAAVRMEAGAITQIGSFVTRRPGDRQLGAGGAHLRVGLHDHHLHLQALAAVSSSLVVGPPDVADRATLAAALHTASAALPPGAWLRAVSYHESVAGALDRLALDAWVPRHPVRLQHRSGALWVLNSLAIDRLGVNGPTESGIECDATGRPTGRLWRMDGWLGQRLRTGAAAERPGRPERVTAAAQSASLARISAEAATMGVAGFTDATPDRSDDDLAFFADLSRHGTMVQRLHLMVRPGQPPGRPSALTGAPLVTIGPVKVILDDDRLPTIEALTAIILQAHRNGHCAAIHCVTAAQLVVTLAAFADAGAVAGDRIEHGAMIPAGLIGELAASPLTVVTQPGLVAARGDTYRTDVAPGEQSDLWRAASLQRAGVRLAAGSDAPHGPVDPWRAIEAATRRRTPSGAVLGAGEVVDAATAQRWWSGERDRPAHLRAVTVGDPADLILVAPGARPEVTATIINGRIVYRR